MYTRAVVPQQHCSISLSLIGFLVGSRCASLTSPSVVTVEKIEAAADIAHPDALTPRRCAMTWRTPPSCPKAGGKSPPAPMGPVRVRSHKGAWR